MYDTCPTVKVVPSHASQGDFVEINEADFDPAVHKLFDDRPGDNPSTQGTSEAEVDAQKAGGSLPKAKRAPRKPKA